MFIKVFHVFLVLSLLVQKNSNGIVQILDENMLLLVLVSQSIILGAKSMDFIIICANAELNNSNGTNRDAFIHIESIVFSWMESIKNVSDFACIYILCHLMWSDSLIRKYLNSYYSRLSFWILSLSLCSCWRICTTAANTT